MYEPLNEKLRGFWDMGAYDTFVHIARVSSKTGVIVIDLVGDDSPKNGSSSSKHPTDFGISHDIHICDGQICIIPNESLSIESF